MGSMFGLTLDWTQASVRRAGWAPLVVFGTHMVASRVFGVYGAAPDLDIPLHFVGGIAIAYFLWHALRARQAASLLGQLTDAGHDLFALTAVFAATVVWEFAEWTTDRMGLTEAQGGLGDTMLDMVLGVVGGAAFLAANRGLLTRRPRGTTADD